MKPIYNIPKRCLEREKKRFEEELFDQYGDEYKIVCKRSYYLGRINQLEDILSQQKHNCKESIDDLIERKTMEYKQKLRDDFEKLL